MRRPRAFTPGLARWSDRPRGQPRPLRPRGVIGHPRSSGHAAHTHLPALCLCPSACSPARQPALNVFAGTRFPRVHHEQCPPWFRDHSSGHKESPPMHQSPSPATNHARPKPLFSSAMLNHLLDLSSQEIQTYQITRFAAKSRSYVQSIQRSSECAHREECVPNSTALTATIRRLPHIGRSGGAFCAGKSRLLLEVVLGQLIKQDYVEQ